MSPPTHVAKTVFQRWAVVEVLRCRCQRQLLTLPVCGRTNAGRPTTGNGIAEHYWLIYDSSSPLRLEEESNDPVAHPVTLLDDTAESRRTAGRQAYCTTTQRDRNLRSASMHCLSRATALRSDEVNP
eukprot:scaffold303_cov410-Prasinococcus_capsulatus_cf.AAC.8